MEKRPHLLFVTILSLSLVMLPLAKSMYFIDESDNIVGGWLIFKGWNLYKDLFSHHMPFPYYFSTFAGSVVGFQLFGIRVLFYLFILSLLGSTLYLLPKKSWMIPFLSALTYVLFSSTFNGHMLLYDHIAAASIVSLYILLIYKRFLLNLELELVDWVVISLLLSISFYSSAGSAYSLLVLFVFFLALNYLNSKSNFESYVRRFSLKIAAILLAPHTFMLFWFLAAGRFRQFIFSIFTFNSNYYLKYLTNRHDLIQLGPFTLLYIGVTDFLEFLKLQYHSLFVQSKDLFFASRFFDPFQFLKTSHFDSMHDFIVRYQEYAYIVFRQLWNNVLTFESGVFIVANLFLLWIIFDRRFRLLPFLIVFIFTLRVRSQGPYHFSPYYLFLIWSGIYCVYEFLSRPKQHTLLANLVAILIIIPIVTLGVRAFGSYDQLVKIRGALLKDEYFEFISMETENDELIWLVGIDPYVYIQSDRNPAFPYLYYYPWIYDYQLARQEIFEGIRSQRSAVIILGDYFIKEAGEQNQPYALDLLDLLHTYYYEPKIKQLPGLYIPVSGNKNKYGNILL